MFRNRTAQNHNFAIIPHADIPRSKFRMRQTRKQPFNASELIPIMVEEVLPGDVWQHKESLMARLATPIAPVIDDCDIETFYFFVPNRIVSPQWETFITGTEQRTSATVPNTAVNYTIPTIGPPAATGTYTIAYGSLLDHMGVPPGIYTNKPMVNSNPVWAYFQIYNDWFRDANLEDKWEWDYDYSEDHVYAAINKPGDGNTPWDGLPLRIAKRPDYFTSSLPWPQRGAAVQLPLGSTAPVVPANVGGVPGTAQPSFYIGTDVVNAHALAGSTPVNTTTWDPIPANGGHAYWAYSALQADLSAATAATINSIRLAFQTQKLLERDARGGSRYVEQLLSHFGVRAPDFRLQRSEYLGGSKTPITINPIAQTAQYDAANPGATDSALGNLGAEMHASSSRRTFSYSVTEHGYIIGLATARATPTYQQGVRKHWRRKTRLDFYFPAFAMLGEQPVDQTEIYMPLSWPAVGTTTWGYQERWAEYRYTPNEITGNLRSTSPTPMDWWHLAEEFGTSPALNLAFIRDKTQETLARSLATAPNEQWSSQIIMDILHDSTVARLMPAYSVPGLIDHF